MKDLDRYTEGNGGGRVFSLFTVQNLVKQPLTKFSTHRSDLFFFLITKKVSFQSIFPTRKLAGNKLTKDDNFSLQFASFCDNCMPYKSNTSFIGLSDSIDSTIYHNSKLLSISRYLLDNYRVVVN